MIDPIERQQAIDEANAWLLECIGVTKQNRSCGLIRRLEDLPSAQPEIIRCKDCKHWMNEHLCKKLSAYYGSIDTDADFFCGYAERREE